MGTCIGVIKTGIPARCSIPKTRVHADIVIRGCVVQRAASTEAGGVGLAGLVGVVQALPVQREAGAIAAAECCLGKQDSREEDER